MATEPLVCAHCCRAFEKENGQANRQRRRFGPDVRFYCGRPCMGLASWAHVKTVIAGPVFPSDWNRYTVSDWHRQTVGTGVKDTHGRPTPGLKLAKRLPLRKARHHFAVRLLESGAAIRVVAEQLGSDERTVLKYYGPWITSSEDRARAEKMAGKHETKRREAK